MCYLCVKPVIPLFHYAFVPRAFYMLLNVEHFAWNLVLKASTLINCTTCGENMKLRNFWYSKRVTKALTCLRFETAT